MDNLKWGEIPPAGPPIPTYSQDVSFLASKKSGA